MELTLAAVAEKALRFAAPKTERVTWREANIVSCCDEWRWIGVLGWFGGEVFDCVDFSGSTEEQLVRDRDRRTSEERAWATLNVFGLHVAVLPFGLRDRMVQHLKNISHTYHGQYHGFTASTMLGDRWQHAHSDHSPIQAVTSGMVGILAWTALFGDAIFEAC